jgi:hypothetical protein
MWRLESLTLAIRKLTDSLPMANLVHSANHFGQGHRADWMNDGPTNFVNLVTELNLLWPWEFRESHQSFHHG